MLSNVILDQRGQSQYQSPVAVPTFGCMDTVTKVGEIKKREEAKGKREGWRNGWDTEKELRPKSMATTAGPWGFNAYSTAKKAVLMEIRK